MPTTARSGGAADAARPLSSQAPPSQAAQIQGEGHPQVAVSRFLVVQPGASFATNDIHEGLCDAWLAAGHEVVEYALDGRILESEAWLRSLARRHKRRGGPLHDLKPSEADVLYLAGQGVLERALRFEVDWVLVVSAMYLLPEWLILLKRAGLKVGVLFTESPYDDAPQLRIARLADAVWTNERSSVAVLKTANPHTFYLRHAYDPAKHYPAPPSEDVGEHDVVFVGTGFQERIETLEAVNWDGIDFGLYGTWDLLKRNSPLKAHIKGGVVNNATAVGLYRRAKIGLNLYRTSMGYGPKAPRVGFAHSLNPRTYELAACGVFTLSDFRTEVAEVFGELVPTFATPAELETLIRRYVADGPARWTAAAQLPSCVAEHTYAARAAQVVADLEAVQASVQKNDAALAAPHT